jgi:hypothetical protein
MVQGIRPHGDSRQLTVRYTHDCCHVVRLSVKQQLGSRLAVQEELRSKPSPLVSAFDPLSSRNLDDHTAFSSRVLTTKDVGEEANRVVLSSFSTPRLTALAY